MNEFNDSVLRDQLQRLGGHGPDEDEAYLRLQQRVRIAKRRRAAAVLGGLGVTLTLGFAAAAYQHPTNSRLAPADGGKDVFVTVSSVTETTEALPSASSEPTEGSVDTTQPATVASNASNSGNNNSNSTSQAQSSQGKSGSGTVSNNTASTVEPPTTTNTVISATPIPPTSSESLVKSSAGGTATVKLQGGGLVLVSYAPSPGFTQQVDRNDPDRIRVTFHGDVSGNSVSYHIEFTIESGHIVGDVTN